ncbi:stilbene synthase [Francisella halioticida]|uniref:Stilbene synthase n=1 Tax=Francisella halioticida TaxID=549298 RepID=A0ABM6LZ28_9GAMM|nr:DUF2520 domain-containing protein [Francisella halioticida]ASG67837.1 stilbene synthase [Francisella halioticida]BCD90692.1 stilbene synthase [Francisella halioticida]
MQQVPKYVIVGDGNVASHMCYYFECLKLDFKHWSRKEEVTKLDSLLDKTTHVLVLIKDDQIENFINDKLFDRLDFLIIIHFSGALNIGSAIGAHPLQSFPDKSLYSFEEYKSIPFIIDNKDIEFSKLLPGLPNHDFSIDKQSKPYYHAMCILANNVTTLIWKKFCSEMESRFNIDKIHLIPYLEKTFKNIKENHNSLSGPIARGDLITLQKDLDALVNDNFYDFFKTIVNQFSIKDKI